MGRKGIYKTLEQRKHLTLKHQNLLLNGKSSDVHSEDRTGNLSISFGGNVDPKKALCSVETQETLQCDMQSFGGSIPVTW